MSFPRTNIWFWIWHSHMGHDAASNRHSLTDCNRGYPLPQGILYLVLTVHSMLELHLHPNWHRGVLRKKHLNGNFQHSTKVFHFSNYLFTLWHESILLWLLVVTSNLSFKVFARKTFFGIAWRKVKGSMGGGGGGAQIYLAHPAFLHFTRHNPFLNTSLTSELTPLTSSPNKNQHFPFY